VRLYSSLSRRESADAAVLSTAMGRRLQARAEVGGSARRSRGVGDARANYQSTCLPSRSLVFKWQQRRFLAGDQHSRRLLVHSDTPYFINEEEYYQIIH
jgi:hypothetical protein